jgi:hypothetical protein
MLRAALESQTSIVSGMRFEMFAELETRPETSAQSQQTLDL